MDQNILSMLMSMMHGQGMQGGGSGGFGSSLMQLLSGLRGQSGRPFEKGMDEYSKWMNQGIEGYKPFQKAGVDSLNPFQKRLGEMQDPTAFYKNMMSGYQTSPLAQNQIREGMQQGTNMASANGLAGSTPMMQQMQQNAQNISSNDMGNYFNNLNGINTNYMTGLKDLMGQGMNAQGGISDLFSKLAEFMGNGAAGKAGGQNQDWGNIIGGLFGGLFG